MSAIREPTAHDADALGAIHVRAWQHAYRGGLMPDDYLDGLSVHDRAALWRDALQRPSRPGFARLVAEDDSGQVVGFIAVGPQQADGVDDVGEVFALNVDPDAWDHGYGRALLEAGVRALAGAGFGEAILWVHPDNARARRFYETAGWRADGEQRHQEVLGVVVPEVRYRLRFDGEGR